MLIELHKQLTFFGTSVLFGSVFASITCNAINTLKWNHLFPHSDTSSED